MKKESQRLLKTLVISALIFALVDAQNTTTPSGSSKGKSNNACYRDLLQTYSLTGMDIPVIDKIEMCPGIVRTCCLKQDQQIIYTSFIHGGENQRVIDHYGKVIATYYNLIEKLMEVQEFAKTVKKNTVKKIANCKLLAERILNYEVAQIQDQIRQNLSKFQEFFQVAYSGFYCTICNFDNHKFFDSTTQTVFFSEDFCRDVVENTLQTLLLFHVDIVKHVNLVTKFVSSCDFTGTYNLEAISPPDFKMMIVNDDMQDLQACRDNRNKREWFSYCKDICNNFQISSFSHYFEPNLRLISLYIGYLTTQLNSLTQAQSSRPLFGALSTPNGGAKRILQEAGANSSIFNKGLSAKVDLAKWKTETITFGISFLKEGQNSLINESTYNSVKTFLQILSSQNSNQGTIVKSNPTTAKTTARKLNSSLIIRAISSLVLFMIVQLK